MEENVEQEGECFLPNKRIPVLQEIKAINKERREILHVISTSSTDRAGDVVEAKGADIDNYMRNPVVMANHDYRIEMIIGRGSVMVQDDSIIARTAYLDTPLGNTAFKLAEAGLGGHSIGFRPLKWKLIEDSESKGITGMRFTKWELLEYSMVAIPMNQDAVMNCIQRGIMEESQVPIFAVVQPEKAAVDTPTAKATDDGRREAEDALASVTRVVRARAVQNHVEAAARRLLYQDAARRIDEIRRRYENA